MPQIGLTAPSTTTTTVTLAFTAMASDGTIDVQIGVRPDFQNCVAPIFQVPRATPVTLNGLNQDTPYYVRARSRRASGALEDWSVTEVFRTALASSPDLSVPQVMIMPAMLVVPNPVMDWTADSSVAGFPADNMGFDAPVGWQSAGQTIGTDRIFSFLVRMAPAPVDTIALLMSNLPEAARVQLKAGNTTTTIEYTSATFPFRASNNLGARPGYHGLIQLPAAQTFPYWRVTITCPSLGIPGVIHLQHAIFGKNRVTKNHSVDKVEQPIDYGVLQRGRTGIPQRALGLRARRVDFDISLLKQADFETTYGDLTTRVGNTDPVLVVPNARSGTFFHDRILYGAITASKTVNNASPVFTQSFSVESII